MRRRRIKLARVGVLQAGHIARKFDACGLHTEANPEIRNFLFASIADCHQHAFNATLAESAGHQDAVVILQLLVRCRRISLQPLGFDPVQVELQVVRQRAVDERLLQRFVGVFILHIFADNADRNFRLRVIDAVNQLFPRMQIAILGLEVQIFQDQLIHALPREHHRDFVDRRHILRRDHRLFFHIAEQRDL